VTTPRVDLFPSSGNEAVRVEWLLQAGFLISGQGGAVAIDPYLSNLCERVHGLTRARSAPFDGSDLPATLVLVSHWHEDHLDLDAALDLAHRGIAFAGPASCRARFVALGLPGDLFTELNPGESISIGRVTATATPAVHRVPGYLTEDAVGFVVSLDGIHVFHTGDSEYHRSIPEFLVDWQLAAALVCVNGTGGNMNVLEAATLVAQLNVDVAVPMHFGLWESEDQALPADLSAEFARVLQAIAPSVIARQPVAGQPFSLPLRPYRGAHPA
jgi:L-ascorbate metabolism protein UlaG (beta-lactamase superfamily)